MEFTSLYFLIFFQKLYSHVYDNAQFLPNLLSLLSLTSLIQFSNIYISLFCIFDVFNIWLIKDDVD